MSMLNDLNLDEYVEPQTFEVGSEIEVKCIDAEIKGGTNKNGDPWEMLSLVLNPANYEDYPEITNPKAIYHPVWLADKGAESWKIQNALRDIKRVYDAIGEYPEGGKPNPTDFKGKTFRVILGNKENNSGELENTVRKFIAA